LVATSGGPTDARIGVMRALNRHDERVSNPDGKDHRWGRRTSGSRLFVLVKRCSSPQVSDLQQRSYFPKSESKCLKRDM
jgi:hypothetical protein